MNPKQLAQHFSGRAPLIHIVLDGWGLGAKDYTNALHLASLPVMTDLLKNYVSTELWTHGKSVGLPTAKDMGGSEVGHMTMGAGQVMEQGATLISEQIKSGEFFQGEVVQKIIRHCLEHKTPLHLMGLLSDGNIHSHYDHFVALIRHAFQSGVQQCYVHALLDGRDVPIQSALDYTEAMEALFLELRTQRPEIDYAFASGGGREQITMDRDNNWSKIEDGWNVHVRGDSTNSFESIKEAILHFREQSPGLIDQDIPGFVLTRNGSPIAPILDNHALVFMNFRADRALEFSKAILDQYFIHFDRIRPDILYAGMMMYDQDEMIPQNYLLTNPTVKEPFGKRLVEMGIPQFRLSETQKFAHVTFFYNGGYREPLDPANECYHLIESDRISSFAQKPEMKAFEIGKKAIEFIHSGKYPYGLINFPNADMVGHSGDLEATIQAVETVDHVLGLILRAVEQVQGLAVITADHGNADQMLILNTSTGLWEPSTKHSLNPVPFLIYDPLYRNDYQLIAPQTIEQGGLNLSQIAATNFILMGKVPPSDLNESLFKF